MRLAALSILAFGSLALASPPVAAAVNTTPAVAKAGGGQRSLAVGFDDKGQLRAHVCAADPCTLDGATPIAVPEEAARLSTTARLRVARLGLERKAVVVEIPDPKNQRTWTAIVTTPLNGGPAITPFAGYTGLLEGVEGERTGPMVQVRDEGVYVGVQREGQDLCGRPAMLAPQALDPLTLTLKAVKLQRLTDAEMEGAPNLAAERTQETNATALLSAEWATSAAPGESPGALTDRNPATVWAENRGGAGRGEFAVLRAPREVPLAGFDVTLPPTTRTVAHGTSPKELFLVTDHEVFRVTFPKEEPRPPAKPVAGATPDTSGPKYAVKLPAPVKTACLAVVMESAALDHKDASVAIAEITARPASAGSVEELVRALAGGGDGAAAAGAVLRASGPEALAAVAAAFPALDEGGRRVALDVLDDASCEVALPAYIEARVGSSEGNSRHASAAFARCGESAAAAIAAALPKQTKPEGRVMLADELSRVSPETMIAAVVPLLDSAKPKERRAYRVLIGNAASQERARDAIAAELGKESTSPRELLELLRALGPNVPVFADSAHRAFARVAVPNANFRTRYLLLGPAAELARTDAAAQTFLRQALVSDERAEIRAEAARSVRDVGPLLAELTHAADDARVRVREASVVALGTSRLDAAIPTVARRLRGDPWPLVRRAAAEALAELPASARIDDEIARTVEEDESPEVRRASVRVLGVHRAISKSELVRERLTDKVEDMSVRAEAALALGAMCDASSTDLLTEHAKKLVDPNANDDQRTIGRNALTALAWLGPRDLDARVASLRGPKTPPAIRKLTELALSGRGRCPPPRSTAGR